MSESAASGTSAPSGKRTVRIGVLISGNGSNLQAIIDQIEAGKINAIIACVISNRKDAFGLERARRHGIPSYYKDHRAYPDRTSFDASVVSTLREHCVELVALAGFNRILSQIMLDAYPLSILNIHPALLPSFPGSHAQRLALEHGVKIAGCTVHFVDAGTDTGPIIAQAAVPVLDSDTEETLSQRILSEEHKIYPAAIRLFTEGRIRVDGRKVFVDAYSEPVSASLLNPRP